MHLLAECAPLQVDIHLSAIDHVLQTIKVNQLGNDQMTYIRS